MTMRRTVAFAVGLWALVAAVHAGESVVHDCRIKVLDIVAHKKGDALILKAVYLGFDGRPLSPRRCPDQMGPSFGFTPPEGAELLFSSLDEYGYVLRVEGVVPGTVYDVSVSTCQLLPPNTDPAVATCVGASSAPSRALNRHKRIRF